MEYIMTFKNTNHAIKAEQCLLKGKLYVAVLPLPSQIREGCGICLRVNPNDIKQAIEVLADNNIDEIGLFLKTTENGKGIYTEVERGSISMERSED
ncbi:MAG: DUF3343 domain-containing protein [Synergistaceae bacterium]|jgi:hypothetical protein|nr:DUF3343 domain-containing protein [Synergistaceae bacterium]